MPSPRRCPPFLAPFPPANSILRFKVPDLWHLGATGQFIVSTIIDEKILRAMISLYIYITVPYIISTVIFEKILYGYLSW